MSDLPLCACVERHECEARSGFRWFRPTTEWFLEGELRKLVSTDRNLADLLELERRRRLGPAQSSELISQREIIRDHFSTAANAAAGQLMATHRCQLYRDAAAEGIRDRKAKERLDDDFDRRMM